MYWRGGPSWSHTVKVYMILYYPCSNALQSVVPRCLRCGNIVIDFHGLNNTKKGVAFDMVEPLYRVFMFLALQQSRSRIHAFADALQEVSKTAVTRLFHSGSTFRHRSPPILDLPAEVTDGEG